MKLDVDLLNHSYPIYIERNAIQKVHEYIPVTRKIAIITDTGVPEKWVQIVKEQCPDSFVCTIPQGEPSKCFNQYKHLLEEMIQHNMSRKDAIIAVGGGVVGDLAGFVAASGSLTLAHSQNSQMSFMYGFFFVKFLFFTVVCVVIVI